MKHFTPILAPREKPDPWWVRLFSYAVITAIVVGFFVAGMFAYWILYENNVTRRWHYNRHAEEETVVLSLKGAAVAGALAGIGYCVWAERAHRERMAWRREVRRRGARGESD